jgi:hypothetical protein
MSVRQLKSLIDTGHYKPEPALVAEAMLQRRGVRVLLRDDVTAEADRSQTASSGGPRRA